MSLDCSSLAMHKPLPPLQPRGDLLHLCYQRARRRALIPPRRRQDTNCLVVSRQPMNTGFDQDKPKFGVLVFPISLQVLADGDRL